MSVGSVDGPVLPPSSELTAAELLAAARYHQACSIARRSADAFTELVIKTETGDPCEVAPIHKVITSFIEDTWRQGYYAGILAPFGHGKTTHCILGRGLFEIGRNTNIRVKVISATDDIAMTRVSAMRRYVQLDPTYHDVFPEVRQANLGEWTKHKFYIERKGHAVDPTLEAKGLLEGGTGGRADLLMFDDVIDYNNTIAAPAKMPMAYDAINSVWLKRKESSSRVLSIGTAWHTQDSYFKLMKQTGSWRWLIIRVSQDFNRLECEVVR